MGTLVEEIFSRRLSRTVNAGEIVMVDVDAIMSHDNTTPLAIKAFSEIGKPIRDTSKIVIHFDHAYPAPNQLAAENQQKIVRFIQQQGIDNFYHRGVCHQVMIEEGYVRPGGIIIGGDSHTVTYGALGCFSTGLGSSEIGAAWVTGKCWFKIPETILVRLEGTAPAGVYSKDVMLALAGQLGMDGATYKSLEFAGSYIDALPAHARIVFSNMSVELGAKCGLIAPDQTTLDYLEAETKARGPFEQFAAVNPHYERTITIDVSTLQPMVACHPDVDQVKPLAEMVGLSIDEVYLGTCTNARYEDLEIAAGILKGRQVSRFTRTLITPASQTIYEKALAAGLIQIFLDAGCTVNAPGCGACIGRHGGILAPGERAFTTMNRNFIGRMGSAEAEIYLGSPAAAAATAIEGRIADPRPYLA
ncbi:MAG TPA: 3-isopropylmalate dehydratase large subunit [Anaerolineaceae bacterium]|nr:3-isopropylmalate dehydratase large subunit [Anaerolineaceae bacterium]